ncbi:hypothetical protein E2C01_001662 [Portunus trituberculatus]|uniref:Uncharacterized protein n=1 Tax=Portunus trituberculatus TaxID=210409 RepID=A0A5B7CI67_PORTR|nr:hypothetical protein [Portunus trituberculatus]
MLGPGHNVIVWRRVCVAGARELDSVRSLKCPTPAPPELVIARTPSLSATPSSTPHRALIPHLQPPDSPSSPERQPLLHLLLLSKELLQQTCFRLGRSILHVNYKHSLHHKNQLRLLARRKRGETLWLEQARRLRKTNEQQGVSQ